MGTGRSQRFSTSPSQDDDHSARSIRARLGQESPGARIEFPLEIVAPHVIGACLQNQVARSVVSSNLVSVMGDFVCKQSPPKFLFHDQAMFEDVPLRSGIRMIWFIDCDVAISGNFVADHGLAWDWEFSTGANRCFDCVRCGFLSPFCNCDGSRWDFSLLQPI